ncbi:MAG: twin-arginine translocase subunit TatC [Anaerolineales bacterium]|nr:twin-arginine translocase subunit TatC [Anaerolineales bacterium]
MQNRFFSKLWRFITAPLRWLYSSIRNFGIIITSDIEDKSLADAFTNTIEHPKDLIFHFDAMRKHILRGLLYFIIATAVAFSEITPILEFLTKPLEGGLQTLQAIDVTEGVGTVMRVALLGGFAMAFPLLAFEIWLFVVSGLRRRQRLPSLLAIPFALLFFVGGMAFAYYLMLPTALPLLLNFMGIETIPRPNSYFPFVVNLLFWMGMSFEFPLVVFILAKLGAVNARGLASQWRLAIVIIAILSAIITTTTDPANMLLMMLPMIVLYFLGIGLALIGQKPKTSNEPVPSQT